MSTLFLSQKLGISALILSSLALPMISQARPQEGSYLGETQLSYAENDKDVIRLGSCPPNQPIDSIKVAAVRGNADIKLMRVRFDNNQTQDLSVRSKINQGSQTPWIDLKGDNRCVKSVVIIGDTTDYSRSPATLQIYAKRGTYQARPQEGSYLGETQLSYAENDRDVIRLGNCPPNQPIDSIKVAAVRGNADIKLVRVRFDNNQTQDLSVRSKINQGSQTPWIDLKGDNRCVKSVVIIGDTTDYSRSPATLQIYAKRGTYQARPQEGSYLGETQLSYAENDRDVIRLGNCPPNRPINYVKFAAVRGTADIRRVRVRFDNNQTQDLSVRSKINQGSETSWIDLRSNNRCVRAIAVVGDTADYSRRPATLKVYGR